AMLLASGRERRIKLRLYRPRPGPERRRIWLESVGPKISFKFRVSSLEMRPFNARYRTGLQLIIPSLGLETETRNYLLYSSTINCSFTGRLMSSRLGSESTRPLR